jgi:hypothetical protein
MRAAVVHSAAGALLLTALAAAPAGGAPERPGAAEGPGAAERRGTEVAAARAAAAGISFGPCPGAADLPGALRCGTVTVPLDYARPDGRQIRLTVGRVRATGKDPRGGGRAVPRQGALVYNPGGPGASGLYFPLAGLLPEWKRLAAAYDLVGYAPRGVAPSAPLSCQDPERFFPGPGPAPQQPSASYKRQRVAQARAAPSGPATRCATTTPSTTPATWTWCGRRWARSG